MQSIARQSSPAITRAAEFLNEHPRSRMKMMEQKKMPDLGKFYEELMSPEPID